MNLGVFGLLDIFIIILTIAFLVFGFIKGYYKRYARKPLIIAALIVLLFAFLHYGQLAKIMTSSNLFNISKPIYNEIYKNANKNFYPELLNSSSVQITKALLKTDKFFAYIISNGISLGSTQEEIVSSVASQATTMIVNWIAFAIIFVGLSLFIITVAYLAKRYVVFDFLDRVLGALVMLTTLNTVVSIIFTILHFSVDYNWIPGLEKWLSVDLQLNSEKYRIGKSFYNNNSIYNIIRLLIK